MPIFLPLYAAIFVVWWALKTLPQDLSENNPVNIFWQMAHNILQ
jgi:hypothetical protein